uniref:SnoaL-like domain-containing protein n=1 Tax=Acrobeloides nanus TaxID=290746 RepID=A0A914E948_9BILA
MPLTQEELNKTLDNLQADFKQIYETKDLEQIVNFYHPQAVMIDVGRSVKYGREEIRKVMQEWLTHPPAHPVSHPEKRFEAGDGEFLIDIGMSEVKFDNGMVFKCKYECIYKKEDGKYFLYHEKNETESGETSCEKKE